MLGANSPPGRSTGRAARIWIVLLAFLGPVSGVIGWFWLAGQDAVLGAVMLFAAGGILYPTFQDIAPQSRLETPIGRRHSAPCWDSGSPPLPRPSSPDRPVAVPGIARPHGYLTIPGPDTGAGRTVTQNGRPRRSLSAET